MQSVRFPPKNLPYKPSSGIITKLWKNVCYWRFQPSSWKKWFVRRRMRKLLR